MFDRLIDVLLDSLRLLVFWEVLAPYQRAVVATLGSRVREIGPGFHFVWPLGIDSIMRDNIVPVTRNLGPQSLTTKDDHQVTVTPVVTYGISDIKKFILEIESGDDAVSENVKGLCYSIVSSSTWDQLRDSDPCKELTSESRKRLGRMGVDIKRVQFSDFSKSPSYRLWQTTNSED